MRSFCVGYFLILFTPFLSFVGLILLEGVTVALWPTQEYLPPILLITGWNVSIMVLWIIAIALYMHGYLRQGVTDAQAKVILLFSFILIPWAVFTYFIASGFILDMIDRSMHPGMMALTIWDYIPYWTWELKAIVWIGTGLLLIVTSLLKIGTSRLKMQARNISRSGPHNRLPGSNGILSFPARYPHAIN
jgi:hypothetical protein